MSIARRLNFLLFCVILSVCVSQTLSCRNNGQYVSNKFGRNLSELFNNLSLNFSVKVILIVVLGNA